MKTFGLIAVLAASVVTAGNAESVDQIEPPGEYNAQWQILGDRAACVRDGMDVYGSNDKASLSYMGQPINLGGYDGVIMRINYSQVTADEGDYCELYLVDDYDNYTLVHTFEDSDGSDTVSLMLDDYYGTRDLKMFFLWVSDETGVDEGFRMFYLEIYGAVWGEGEYTNFFTWGSPDEVTGHQIFDVTDMIGNMVCLAFTYETEGSSQGWWAIDNVALDADGESILPLQAGGYGTEDFSSGGWYQDQQGEPGEWEIDTDHDTGGMSGENWQADSGANPGQRYQAETLSPWFRAAGANMVACSFDTWFSPMDAGDYASIGYYSSDDYLMFLESFNDLDDWYANDYGSDVVETSWGAIKADF